jgi:predicted nucleic acid-binding protein
VDYFQGEPKARGLEKIISSGQAAVSVISLAEIKLKLSMQKKDWQPLVSFMRSNARIIPIDEKTALLAGDFVGLHASDALIYASAVANGMTLITSDKDFTGCKNVRIL